MLYVTSRESFARGTYFVEEPRACRVRQNDEDLGVHILQVGTDTGNRSPGALKKEARGLMSNQSR